MHEYNKKTIDEIIWVVYKTSQEGTMFHYKDDEHAQEHITNFLKEIGKIKDSNPIVEYKGEILWDKSKPDGTPKKLLNINKIKSIGWEPKISLEEGIIKTIKDYEVEYG